jgi:hypothetical protein
MKLRLSITVVGTAFAVLGVGCDGLVDDSSVQGNPNAVPNSTTVGSFLETDDESDVITEIPANIRDYFDRSVEERKRVRRALNLEIAQLNKARRGAPTEEQRLTIGSEIEKRNQKLIELETSYPVPPLNLSQLKEGLIGGIARVLVVQVQEGSTALVCRSSDRNMQHIVMLKLLSFANLTPNEEGIFETPFQVSGTTNITTARGGERTVFVLKTFRNVQLEPYKPLYEQEHPKSETDSSSPNTPVAVAKNPANESPSVQKTTEADPPSEKKPPKQKPSAEKAAASQLKLAKVFVEKGNTAVARKRLQSLVDDYPETKSADKARRLLDSLDK